MPARSESQRKLFGLALSVKRGDTPRSSVGKNILDIVDSMSEDQIKDYAVKESRQFKKKKLIESILKESEERKNNLSLTVTFDNLYPEDLEQLQGMFKAMSWSGIAGSSGGFKVYVDGDGSFRAKIKMDPEPSEEITKKYLEDFDNEKMDIGLGC